MPPENTDALAVPIRIGEVETRNAVFLAPMSGVSDVPFRRLAWEFGAGMVTSEMVASEALVTGQAEMAVKAESGGLPIHMVQLAGREAQWMDRAARIAEANGAHIIDINMGCPARRVTSGYSGSALMRDPDHALSLVEAVVGAVKVPVTLKMRLGWDENSINAPEIAKRAVNAGIAMITVHGRTRCQFYKGQADWRAVRAVRDAVDVPLIVNGDVSDRNDALEALRQSGADGVMIGRASYGQPDLCGAIAGAHRQGEQVYAVVEHVEAMMSFYGVSTGLRCSRKHVGWYLDRRQSIADTKLRTEILTCNDPNRLLKMLEALDNAGPFGEPGASRWAA